MAQVQTGIGGPPSLLRAGYRLIGNLAYKALLRGYAEDWKKGKSGPLIPRLSIR